MRSLVLLRGCPGSGKSSWIRENNLEQYTLSADSIRLLFQSPVLNKEGNLVISQKNDGKVWKLLFQLLEDRMSRGEFTIVDATHYKSTLLNRYKELVKKYRYRVIIADFTDVSLPTLIERNNNRDEFKRVPEEVIRKMHLVFQEDTEVSNRFKIVHRDEIISLLKEDILRDFNDYNKVVFIGDIHGCYDPLAEYFKNGLEDNVFYIFLGDYIDRGIQNKEVLEFIINIKDRRNVLLLEGNHEITARKYAEDNYSLESMPKEESDTIKKYCGKEVTEELKKSMLLTSTFKNKTMPQIETIDKKSLRQLCRKLGQLAYFKYGNNVYLATHGGLSNVPNIFTQTEDIIRGVGGYSEVASIDESFVKNTPNNYITIHGHRNIFMDETEQFNGRVYNLNDRIEKGGYLRILEVTKENNINEHKVIKIKNNTFEETLCVMEEKTKELPKTSNDIINALNVNKNVNKKVLNNGVVSYNFSRDVFHKNIWNEQTIRARGLFIDNKSSRIMARSYDKFFNWSQHESTKSEALKRTFKFPVISFRKENGFLGILSYDFNNNSLFVCSKTTNQGDYADMFREQIDLLDKDYLLEYTKENNVSLIFEVINQDKDPHMIRYPKNKIILLDIIRNEFETEYLPYEEVVKVGNALNIDYKRIEYVFNDWENLYAWRQREKQSYDTRHEGWVITDSNNFSTKMKSKFYNFWKDMRKVKTLIENNKATCKTFKSEEEVEVHKLLKSIDTEILKAMSIIDIEEIYYENKNNLLEKVE